MVRRVIKGKETWVHVGPPCATCAGETVSAWRQCSACRFACTHWDCRECHTSVVDAEHACRAQRSQPSR